MIRSKKIDDYFPAKLEDIRPNEEITFDTHLYFRKSTHIIVWQKSGLNPNEENLKKYKDRNLETIWIHKDDRKAYEEYMTERAQAAAASKEAGAEDEEARTEEGALISEVLRDPDLTPEEKDEIISAAAQEVLEQALEPENREEQEETNKDIKKIVQDILDSTSDQADGAVADILQAAHLNPELQHAVNVSTYSVVFALAFGKMDTNVLSELAMSGLLHDIGMTKVPFDVAQTPMLELDEQAKSKYEAHVDAGIKLIRKHGSEVSETVQSIIVQHHEMFDGRGYPKGIEGFDFADFAQILSLADLVEMIGAGFFDGKQRSLKDSIAFLVELEQDQKHFNPDVFNIAAEWIQSEEAQEGLEQANEIVKERVDSVVS